VWLRLLYLISVRVLGWLVLLARSSEVRASGRYDTATEAERVLRAVLTALGRHVTARKAVNWHVSCPPKQEKSLPARSRWCSGDGWLGRRPGEGGGGRCGGVDGVAGGVLGAGDPGRGHLARSGSAGPVSGGTEAVPLLGRVGAVCGVGRGRVWV
jgi:hypothetical protein